MAGKRDKRDEEADVLEGLGGEDTATAEGRGRLTPVDIQQKVFRLAFRGYNERDVDEFLDRVTEDFAALHEENKRLKEQIAEGGGVPAGADQQEAEAVVRQAREHAARLIEEAESRASRTTSGTPAPTSYLAREREFLQTLASLVQDHARRLKEEARRSRSSSQEPDSAAASGSPPATPARQEAEESPTGPAVIPGPAAAPPTDDTASPEEGPPGDEAAEPVSEDPTEAEAGDGSAADPQPPEPRAIAMPEPEGASLRTGPSPASVAEGPSEAASDRSGGQDPLLSAWDAAFAGPDDAAASSRGEPGEGSRRDRADEPSLRELFWGEE